MAAERAWARVISWASPRDRQIARGTIAALGARLGIAVVAIVTVPVALGSLGVERYGIWVALTSAATMVSFGDLGIGNGLVNLIGLAVGREDRLLARRAVSAATVMVGCLAIGFALVGSWALLEFPWVELVGSGSGLADVEARPAALTVLVLVVVGLPLSLVDRIRLGFQNSHVSSMWALVGAGISLVGLLVAAALHVGLPAFILLTAAPPLLALGLNGAALFFRDQPWLAPSVGLVDRSTLRHLVRIGFLFFVLQLAIVVAYQSDVLVAAVVAGARGSATYSIALSVFLFVPSLLGIALTNVWPAYSEAIARGDISWIERTLRRTIIVSVAISGVSAVVLIAASSIIFSILTHDTIVVPFELVIGMGIWAVLRSTLNCYAILMNAASVVRFQVVIAVVMAVASVALSLALGKLFGLPGIIWGTVVAYALLAAVPTVLFVPRLLRRLREAATAS